MYARNGSGFDTWIILNILPCDKHIVDIIKNGKGIISLKIFNGYIAKNLHANFPVLNISVWYDSFELFVRKIRKDF